MAPLTLTSSANISTLTVPQLRELIEHAEQEQRELESRIATTRYLLATLTAQERHQVTMERLSNPTVITDFLVDPSYEEDSKYTPSPLDQERESAHTTRRETLGRTDRDVRNFTEQVNFMQSLQETGPARVSALQQTIAQTGRIKNWFTGERDKAQADLQALQSNLAAIEPRLLAAQLALARAQQRRADSTLKPNVPYDFALHAQESAAISPRSNQAVLLSYDTSNDGTATVVLEMPAGPEEVDLTQTLTLRFDNSDDIEEFAALVGNDLRVYGGIFDTVRENVERDYDFSPQLVPFALEVVEVEGVERYRVPQVVLERFVNAVVAE